MSDKVIQYAAIWLQYANLHFEYVRKEENADVKIGFNMDNRWLSWSTIGTDCKLIPQDEVSLNFVDLDEEENEEIIQGEVLRNFGHVLGLGFEHRSPASTITFNTKALNYYINMYALTKEDVINDILPIYNTEQTNYTEFDPNSIMILDVPTSIQDPKRSPALDFNYTLSENDITFVRDSLYPLSKTDCLLEWTINGDLIEGGITLQDSIIIQYSDGHIDTLYNQKQFGRYFHNTGIYSAKIYGSDTAIVKIALSLTNITSCIFHTNKALKEIDCRQNHIKLLEVTKCPALELLICTENNLTEINLLHNLNLQVLFVSQNQLTSLDIYNNKKLKYLDCYENFLTELNISQNKELTDLWCRNNNIGSINLKNNPVLYSVNIGYNNLKNIDVTQNSELGVLHVHNNQIEEIKFGNHPHLDILSCQHNRLTNLDVSSFIKLRFLYCQDNLFSYEALENIASNLNSTGGLILYSPLNDTITALLNEKNWVIPTEAPIYSSELLLMRKNACLSKLRSNF